MSPDKTLPLSNRPWCSTLLSHGLISFAHMFAHSVACNTQTVTHATNTGFTLPVPQQFHSVSHDPYHPAQHPRSPSRGHFGCVSGSLAITARSVNNLAPYIKARTGAKGSSLNTWLTSAASPLIDFRMSVLRKRQVVHTWFFFAGCTMIILGLLPGRFRFHDGAVSTG